MILVIPLVEKGKSLVKQGQHVDFDTSLYEEKIQKDVKILISQKIDVSPTKIFHHLKKLVGETVAQGEILAEKKSFMAGASYKSEYTGILKEIDHTDGSVLIEVATEDTHVKKAFFKGEVVKIDKEGLHIKVNKAKEYELKDTRGGFFGGKALYLKDGYENLYEETASGTVIITEKISPYTQVKAEALGVHGFVTLRTVEETSDLPSAVFKQIKQYEEAIKNKLPYCFINAVHSTIVFYS
ncbi:MAG: hypothetical protein WC489_05255 [Patescibacteria group bacterium]